MQIQNPILWLGGLLSLVLGLWFSFTNKTLTLPGRENPFMLPYRDDGRELLPIAILKMFGLEQGKLLTIWHKKIFGLILIMIGLWLIYILFKHQFFI